MNSIDDLKNAVDLNNIAIILVSSRVSENIGATARAMKNFGLSNLRLVAPRGYNKEKAYRMARKGSDILDAMVVVPSINEAVSDLVLIGATTARQGDTRSSLIHTPSSGAQKLIKGTCRGKVGLMFGPEEGGLETRDLDVSSVNITIPTNPGFSSLNLSQAVLLTCYELFKACETAPTINLKTQKEISPATAGEKEAFFAQSREFLLDAGFLNKQNPDAVLLHLRKLLERAKPTSKEVTILRGIIRQTKWYAENNDT